MNIITTVSGNSSKRSLSVTNKCVLSPHRRSDRDSNLETYWFIWQQLTIRTTCLSLLLGGFLSLSQATTTSAENIVLTSEKLPSPPAVNSFDRSKIQPSSFSSGKFREYIFKKPVLSNSNANPVYLVEVYGDSDLILYQVRKFEPQAFRKKRSIQVGKFSQQQSADALVKKLNRAGLRSRITVVSG
jgi:hypothetical protein